MRYGAPTNVTAERLQRRRRAALATAIDVRDIFIAGLGDGIALGEGNPDKAGRATAVR